VSSFNFYLKRSTELEAPSDARRAVSRECGASRGFSARSEQRVSESFEDDGGIDLERRLGVDINLLNVFQEPITAGKRKIIESWYLLVLV
jgi:hypothetical protein